VINIGTYLGWLSHGVLLKAVPLAAPNVFGLGVAIMVLFFLQREHKFNPITTIAPGVLLGAMMAGLDFFVSSSLFGIAAMIPGVISMSRQGLELLRVFDVSGVSRMSWFMQVSCQAIWLVWGLLMHDPGMLISTIFSLVVASAVFIVLMGRNLGWTPKSVRQDEYLESLLEADLKVNAEAVLCE
jgi:hypothetical protein